MSYSFSLTAKDGKLEAPEEVPHIPDGTFTISGHVNDDGTNESVVLQRRDAAGNSVAHASSWHA